MKKSEFRILAVGLIAVSSFILHPASFAASTINPAPTNQLSYGANIGWMNWYADGTNGAVIGEFVCSGYIYAANIGWIHLGSGSPADAMQYSNTSSNDFGVNHLGDGRLRGYAYGANIGWIVFTNNTATGPLPSADEPRINLVTGNFSGYAYSANCGWISLNNQFARVQTDSLQPPTDNDGDGIPDAWELGMAGNLVVMNGTTDNDGDGIPDSAEYGADTDPLDSADFLRITAFGATTSGATSTVTWTSRPTRLYQVQSRDSLVSGDWATNLPPGLVSPDPGATTMRIVPGTATSNRFFRVRAIKPLMP